MPTHHAKSLLTLGAALLVTVAGTAPARATDAEWVELFRNQVIKCMHGTVNPDKATVELIKQPEKAGDITTMRFKTYYDGLVRKNVMETELLIRQSGSIRQMKINSLSDTGTTLTHCDMEKNWHDF